MSPLELEGAFDSQNIAMHKLIFISKYHDNSILRNEVVRSSYEKSVSHYRTINFGYENTDSQYLLVEQQVVHWCSEPILARASLWIESILKLLARLRAASIS